MDDVDETTRWVDAYNTMYINYMYKNHRELYDKFEKNIHPPQHIGGGPMIGRSARNTDEEYEEIMRISKDFCEKYPEPTFTKH